MGKNTHIQWSDNTFNIAWGCHKYDDLCKNCYAERLDNRYHKEAPHWGLKAERKIMSENYWKQPIGWNKEAERLGIRYKVFCSSMADWAEDHETIAEQRERLFPLIKSTPYLDWQLLTKRFDKVKLFLPDDWGDGYDNVWLGQSVGTQKLAEEYLDTFLLNKAKVIFLSLEPLLEYVNLKKWLSTGKINQCILGGESGNETGKHRYRPCELDWIENIVKDCQQYNVPVFVKQLGSHLAKTMMLNDRVGGDMSEFPEILQIREFPKLT